MADAAEECIEELNFSISDIPRGMTNYDPECLELQAQEKLNELKLKTIRENQQYLKNHPEIKCLIAMLLDEVFEKKPTTDLHEFAAKYFSGSEDDLRLKVDEKMKEMGLIKDSTSDTDCNPIKWFWNRGLTPKDYYEKDLRMKKSQKRSVDYQKRHCRPDFGRLILL